MKELLCVFTRLCLHRCLFFITIYCSFGEKKFNSKRYVSNERPRFTFYNYKLLIKFCFLCAGFTGCIQEYNDINYTKDTIRICKLGLFIIQWIIICLKVQCNFLFSINLVVDLDIFTKIRISLVDFDLIYSCILFYMKHVAVSSFNLCNL